MSEKKKPGVKVGDNGRRVKCNVSIDPILNYVAKQSGNRSEYVNEALRYYSGIRTIGHNDWKHRSPGFGAFRCGDCDEMTDTGFDSLHENICSICESCLGAFYR